MKASLYHIVLIITLGLITACQPVSDSIDNQKITNTTSVQNNELVESSAQSLTTESAIEVTLVEPTHTTIPDPTSAPPAIPDATATPQPTSTATVEPTPTNTLEPTKTHTPTPTPTLVYTPSSIDPLLLNIREDAAARIGVKITDVTLTEVIYQTWPGSGMDCRQSVDEVAEGAVMTPGYKVIAISGDKILEYRIEERNMRIRFCPLN